MNNSPEDSASDEFNDDQELYEHFRFNVDKGQEFIRIDKFLFNRVQNATRTKIQAAAEAGCIRVNDKSVKSSYKVKPLDVITILFEKPKREVEILPENIPLNIVFEDNDLVIINKPAGMVVHPAFGNYTGTLVNALLFHFSNLPENNKSKNDPFKEMRPGLVHRLDKNTSGLMVIAKNELSMARLAKIFFDRNLDRKYRALVWGDFSEDSGTITGNIGRSFKDRKKMDVFPSGEHGKHAVTHWRVIERLGYVTLIECKLETGRTHQIRAHMEHIGHPVFNDEVYGGNKIIKGTTFTKYKQFIDNCFDVCPRHALHAFSLGFSHPSIGNKIYFEEKLPEDMEQLLNKWRNYVKHNYQAE